MSSVSIDTVDSERGCIGRKVLALDLGTKTGWATMDGNGLRSGVWKLAHDPEQPGRRWKTLFHLVMRERPGLIVYEQAGMWRGVRAARVYSGFLTVLELVAERLGIAAVGIHAGTLKKWATGSGSAKKPEMVAAAERLFPQVKIIDDNHADALCVLAWAVR